MTLLRYIVSAGFAVACASATPAMKPASGTPPPSASPRGASPEVAPSSTTPAPSPAAPEAEPVGASVALCDVVCERAFIEPGSDADGSEDLIRATADVNRVLDGMKREVLACFEKRIRAIPQTEAFMTLSIVVSNDGKVRNVETKGGDPLGERAIRCIVDRVKLASFAPPRGRGTMRVEVPFTLRKAGEGEP